MRSAIFNHFSVGKAFDEGLIRFSKPICVKVTEKTMPILGIANPKLGIQELGVPLTSVTNSGFRKMMSGCLEQAGFRSQRSTTEQILNLRLL